MDAQTIIALITALGVGGVIPAVIQGASAQLSGKAEAERKRNADALALRDDAWRRTDEIEARAARQIEAAEADRDAAETRARVMTEYASSLRAVLRELGIPPDELPEWPAKGVMPEFLRDPLAIRVPKPTPLDN